MRITSQLIRSRAHRRPLHTLEYVDLSALGIERIERLRACSKLRTLFLNDNNIDYVSNLDACPELWKLDLSNNVIKSLEGLNRFVALGSLILSNNQLTWPQLVKLRNIHILDLYLHGNPRLEEEPYYRIHVIDTLPNVWMLDGRIITSAERLQVQRFFQDTAMADHPVRHKCPKEHFMPTTLNNIFVNGVFGNKDNIKNSILVEGGMRMEDVLHIRVTEQEKANMLLLLLVASLEFNIPVQLMNETLQTTQLNIIGHVPATELFLLSRKNRCSTVCLLLSAIKVDKDIGEDGGLYDKLYLCLYYSIAELTKISQASAKTNFKIDKKSQATYKRSRSLIGAEVVQLMCIVPAFFEYVTKDPGVMHLVTTATADCCIIERIHNILYKKRGKASRADPVHREALWEATTAESAGIILAAIQQNALNMLNRAKVPNTSSTDIILNVKKALPRRPQSTPLTTSEYATQGRTTPMWSRSASERIKSARPVTSSPTPRKCTPPDGIGDTVLVGPQNIAHILSIPDSEIILVHMDNIPDKTGAMLSKSRDPNDHYSYLRMKNFTWDSENDYWRPANSIGDRVSLRENDMDGMLEAILERCHFPSPNRAYVGCESTLFQEKMTKEIPRPVSVQLKEKLELTKTDVKVNHLMGDKNINKSCSMDFSHDLLLQPQPTTFSEMSDNMSHPVTSLDLEHLSSEGTTSDSDLNTGLISGRTTPEFRLADSWLHGAVNIPQMLPESSKPSALHGQRVDTKGAKDTAGKTGAVTYKGPGHKARPSNPAISYPAGKVFPMSQYRRKGNDPKTTYRKGTWSANESTSASHSGNESTRQSLESHGPMREPKPKRAQWTINLVQSDKWMAGGRNIYEEKVALSRTAACSPGWMQGLPRRKSPATTNRERVTRSVMTPSSIAAEKAYGRELHQRIPEMPPTDTQPTSPNDLRSPDRPRIKLMQLPFTFSGSNSGTVTNYQAYLLSKLSRLIEGRPLCDSCQHRHATLNQSEVNSLVTRSFELRPGDTGSVNPPAGNPPTEAGTSEVCDSCSELQHSEDGFLMDPPPPPLPPQHY